MCFYKKKSNHNFIYANRKIITDSYILSVNKNHDKTSIFLWFNMAMARVNLKL